MTTNGELTAERVADCFAEAVRVSDRYYEELAYLQGDRQPLSPLTVRRLKQLLAMVEPASQMRQQLGEIRSERLLAGLHLWATQSPGPGPGPETLPLWSVTD